MYSHLQKKGTCPKPGNGTEAENSLHLKTLKLATLGQIYHKQHKLPKADVLLTDPKLALSTLYNLNC